MKRLAADVRVRVLLFTVWNTAVETKLFLACYALLRLLHARPGQNGLSLSLLLANVTRVLHLPISSHS